MKKILNGLFMIMVLSLGFIPFYGAEALGSYSVEMVSGTSNNKVIGSYNSYSEALNVMNSQKSSENSVATIYRNGVPVDSKYAIFKFKPSGNSTFPLYRNSNSTSAYTSINTNYAGDAALLGYSDNGRALIMISGFTGWIDINNGVVTPISLLAANMINVNGEGVRLRSEPNMSGSIVAKISGNYNFNYLDVYNGSDYTWYKINYNGTLVWVAGGSWVTRYDSTLSTYYNHYGPTGNLIHHFTVYSGGSYTESFTNLGTSPSYLVKDARYYSFDGNYFYSNLTSMLDDYRSGVYSHSVNSNSPHYAYYLYLTSKSTSGYTADDLNNIVASKGYNASNSKLYGTGVYFKEAEETYGTNALLAFATALNESAWGTSSIALNKNNLFGYGASDSCPYDCAYSYASPRDSIMDYASKSSVSYENVYGSYYYGSHYGNKSSGKNIKYATDPYWGEKMAGYAFTRDLGYGGKDFNSNTIGVTKKGYSNVWVFDKPERTDEAHLYTMKNSKTSDRVYDFTANIVDKVTNNGVEFYKIYTDLDNSSQKYGYVYVGEWNVSNNQPVINANDVSINVGDNFNYMNGVSASDVENGDLTYKITYEGNVDTTKAGDYKVTYTVVDNSNFHASKTINVNVKSDDVVTIEATDKEILQFEKFDYLDGVKAYNKEDLTDKITYEGSVDTSKEGNYEVTYKVNYNGKDYSKKINVKVIKNEKPVITASDKETSEGREIDLLDGVTASDKEDGDLTDKITVEGNVNFNKIGEYEITYSVSDKHGQKTSKTVIVKVIADEKPVINAKDRSVSLNSYFNPLEGVTASDKEDGDLTSKITYSGTVDTSKIAEYEITYSVRDSNNQTATKKVKITVSEKTLIKSDSEFYFDYLREENGKLIIKGYNIIKKINNTLDNNINYYLIFKNDDNEYKIEASRITDSSLVPEYKENGMDYTYSWFISEISIKNIPQGDYTLYVRSESDDYYAENIVNNMLLNEQASNYTEDGRYLTITNDYVDSRTPIVFSIRDKQIGVKETSSFTNQYSYIDDITLKDGILYLKGASYSSGVDMRDGTNLTRNIVFENKESFETYTFDLGYLKEGPYMISLYGTDKFGKDKKLAWYEKSIDLTKLSKGSYVIYVTNKSNISDYGELKDMLMLGDYSKTKCDYDGKKYDVSLNKKVRYRVELNIK